MFRLYNKGTDRNPGKELPCYYLNDVQQIRQIFLDCDVDGNNVLSKDEIKHAFGRLGALIPRYRAWRGLKHADANNDGCVSMEELDDLVRYAAGLGYKIK